MLTARHITVNVTEDYRLIAVSDIHGHLDEFRTLLEKTHYVPGKDYLVINGDFVEKGDQVQDTIRFVRKLSAEERVFVLPGNCEWALEAMMTLPDLADQIPVYLRRVSTNGIVRDWYRHDHLGDGHLSAIEAQKDLQERMKDALDFIRSLPTTLKFNDFIFVHAGLEPRDNYQECGLSSYLEMQRFMDLGHPYPETVIVGHLPTGNYHTCHINNDVIINTDKRIISIDGGMGVKPVSQLNALIISSNSGQVTYDATCVRHFVRGVLTRDLNPKDGPHHKVSFPDFAMTLLEEGPSFSLCRKDATGEEMQVKNEFLYEKDGQLYCLDDYYDGHFTGRAGDEVEVVWRFDDYTFAMKGSHMGWMPSDAVEVLHGQKTTETD